MKIFVLAFMLCMTMSVSSFAEEFCFSAHAIRNNPAKKEKPETTMNSIIKLSDDRLFANGARGQTVYDFKTDMATDIYPESKVFRSMPLAADVAFRVYEVQNRKFLDDVLRKSGTETARLSKDPAFDAAHEFALLMPGNTPAKLTSEEQKDGNVAVSKDGIRIAGFKNSTAVIPEALKDEYKKVWIYLWGIYPGLADVVTQSDKLPEKFDTNYASLADSGKQQSLKIEFKALKDCSSVSDISSKGFTKIYAPDPGLNGLILKAHEVSKRTSHDQYTKEIQGLIDKKKYFEAFVVLNAQVLEYGNNIDKTQGQLLGQHMKEDKRFMVFAQAMSRVPKDKIDLVVKNLDAEASTKMSRSYIFDVYAANILAQKDPQAGKVRMISAIKQYPFATGAWKDLGDMYVKAFETPNGWASYDVARLLNPDFPSLSGLASYEAKFKTDFPGFFKQ